MNVNLQKDDENNPIKLMGIQVIRIQKEPYAIFVKMWYSGK